VNLIVAMAAEWLEYVNIFLNLYPAVAFAALMLPIAISLISRSLLVVVGVLFLMAVALLALTGVPNLAAITIIASYVGAIIIALAAIRSRRRAQAVHADLIALRADVNQLLQAQSRRLLVELNSGKSDSGEVTRNK
jgi:hypothetical protein